MSTNTCYSAKKMRLVSLSFLRSERTIYKKIIEIGTRFWRKKINTKAIYIRILFAQRRDDAFFVSPIKDKSGFGFIFYVRYHSKNFDRFCRFLRSYQYLFIRSYKLLPKDHNFWMYWYLMLVFLYSHITWFLLSETCPVV